MRLPNRSLQDERANPRGFFSLCRSVGLSAIILSSACMTTPLDGTPLELQSQQVQFGGFTIHPNDFVGLEVQSASTGAWSRFADGGRTGTSAITDNRGIAWYSWSKYVTLPSGTSFWKKRGSGASRFVDIEVRAVSASDGVGGTFTNDFWDCVNRTFDELGVWYGSEVLTRCAKGISATISVPCGDAWEACCRGTGAGTTCNGRLMCTDGRCVAAEVDEIPEPPAPPMPPPVPEPEDCSSAMMGAPCEVNPNECVHGYVLVKGRFECVNGRPQCRAKVTRDYCVGGDNGTGLCGRASATECSFSEQCAPGAICNQMTKVCESIPRGELPAPEQLLLAPASHPFVAASRGRREPRSVRDRGLRSQLWRRRRPQLRRRRLRRFLRQQRR